MHKNSNLSVAFCASYTYDAIGNITQYVDEDGHVVASYTYDAFGNTVAQSGAMAGVFPFRFSTKYYDAESSLLVVWAKLQTIFKRSFREG